MREAARRTQQTTTIYIDPASSDSKQEDASSGKGKGKVPAAGPQKKVGQTFGTGRADDSPKKKARVNSNKKGKGGARARQELKEGNGQLGMLLDMPLDVVAEVCSHLEPKDLLDLSVSIKTFRQLLMSPTSASRGIWKQARENAGFPGLTGWSEEKFGKLIGRTTCMECGEARARIDVFLRIRLCRGCRSKNYIAGKKVKLELPHVHEKATSCSLWSKRGPTASRYGGWGNEQRYYVVADLEKVSYKLFQLQDEDELAELEHASNRRKSIGGTRSRRTVVVEEEGDEPTEVEKFVEKKKEWLVQGRKESKAITKVLDDKKQQLRDEANKKAGEKWAATRAKRAAEDAALEVLKAELIASGWTTQQWETYEDHEGDLRRKSLIPTSNPADDPQAWDALKATVDQRAMEDEAESQAWTQERQANDRAYERKQALRGLFNAMHDAQAMDKQVTFSPFNDFLELETVKAFWETDDAPKLIDAVWSMKEKDILDEVDTYRETKRIEAIKLILAATNEPGVELSDDPDDYDEDTYDEAFFGRITSLFFTSSLYWRSKRRRLFSANIIARPFPQVLAHPSSSTVWYGLRVNLRDAISHFQVKVLRAMLKAADLDEVTATVDDLDSIGCKWRWLEYPIKKKDLAQFEWKPLLFEILRRAPGGKKPFPSPSIVVDGIRASKSKKKQVQVEDNTDEEASGTEDVENDDSEEEAMDEDED